MEKKKKTPGFWSAFFTMIFSLLLTASLVLLVPLLFIHALNENVILPAAWSVSGDRLASFFDSRYFFVAAGAFVLIPTLIIVLLNTHRLRRIFLAVGCAAVTSAILSVTAVITRLHVLQSLPGEWQDILINVTAVFKDFGIICSIILIVIGAACMSIYSCITVIKGGRYEKDT